MRYLHLVKLLAGSSLPCSDSCGWGLTAHPCCSLTTGYFYKLPRDAEEGTFQFPSGFRFGDFTGQRRLSFLYALFLELISFCLKKKKT